MKVHKQEEEGIPGLSVCGRYPVETVSSVFAYAQHPTSRVCARCWAIIWKTRGRMRMSTIAFDLFGRLHTGLTAAPVGTQVNHRTISPITGEWVEDQLTYASPEEEEEN